MAELRDQLKTYGFKRVGTYIQSGNIICESGLDPKQLKAKFEAFFLEIYKFEVPTLVLKLNELADIITHCPFEEMRQLKSYYTLLYDVPKAGAEALVTSFDFPDEYAVLKDRCIYFYAANGYGRAKMSTNFFEKQLAVTATSRNHRTLVKMLNLAREI